jgi:hypothetical protein
MRPPIGGWDEVERGSLQLVFIWFKEIECNAYSILDLLVVQVIVNSVLTAYCTCNKIYSLNAGALLRIYMRDLYACRYANANSSFNIIIKIFPLNTIERSINEYIYRANQLVFGDDSIEQLLAKVIVSYLRFISEILINLIFSQQSKCNVVVSSAHALKDSSSDGLIGIAELQLRSYFVFLFDLPSTYVLYASLDGEVISDYQGSYDKIRIDFGSISP